MRVKKGVEEIIMKQYYSAFIFLLLAKVVNSQNSDSCNTSVNFNGMVPFDTTSLNCQSVWESENFVLRYVEEDSSRWSFLLSAPNPNTYIAIGFSKSGRMVGSSAIVGWSGKMIRQYYLKGRSSSQVLLDQGDLTIVNGSAVCFTSDGRLYLGFQLTTVDSSQPSNKLLYAVGPSGFIPSESKNYRLREHRKETATTLNYATGQSEIQNSVYSGIRRTHGAMNMVGWGILMPIGALIARYLKKWDPAWFYSHLTIQAIAFLTGLPAFILGFVVEGLLNAQVYTHKTIGIFILVLGCLQVTALFVRPGKGSKIRKYWNWFHHFGGRILLIFAISNIFYGISLGGEGFAWNASYGVIVGILLITAIGLEFKMRREDD